jgi:lysozyme family protein
MSADTQLFARALRAAADALDPPVVVVVPETPPPPPTIVVVPVPVPVPAPAPAALTPIQQALAALFASCAISPEHVAEVSSIVDRILQYQDSYAEVEAATGVPWYVVASIHSLEADLDFTCHLYNGDPLSARTVNEPTGRPIAGIPPFTWIKSAIDALDYDGLSGQSCWAMGVALDRVERYNGLGYRYRGFPSPYLWSGTNHYTAGRFVADHVFDPKSVSKQCGVAALIQALTARGTIKPLS